MADLVPHTLNLFSDFLVLLPVLMHKSVEQNLFLDIDFVEVLERLIVFKVKPVQL